MLSNKKAVSTIIVIILLLCAAVFGAFLSYMWALSNFYLEPTNTSLAITNLDFSPYHSDYFYVTVMNPSSSPSGTSITAIYFTVNGSSQVYDVTDTSPVSLPIPLERATNETIECISNWGNFAGSTITVHVSALNASGAVASVDTSFVKLGLQVQFNATKSCRQFNVTITNSAQSAINLTLTNLYINQYSIYSAKRLPAGQNVSISGINLPKGQNVSLECLYDWETFTHPEILVGTLQGYQANATANATAAVLLLPSVAFNETNPDANEMSITVYNSNASSNAVDVADIFVTYNNGTATYYINGSDTSPSFAPYYALGIGDTVTFDHCIWNWGDFRNQTVTVSVNVTQGFTPASTTVVTPSSLVFNITDLSFNLNDTSHFVATIASMPVSLENANITMIRVNGTDVENFTSQIINIGEEGIFNCTFDWRSFRGKNANITAELSNGEIISRNIALPIVDLKLLVDQLNFAKSIEGIPYVNITVSNSIFSNKTVNVTQIIFETGNKTYAIDGTLTYPALSPNGYVLDIGANVTILCPWNWALYTNQNLTITVQTAEGFSVSQTLQIPESTP